MIQLKNIINRLSYIKLFLNKKNETELTPVLFFYFSKIK